MASSPPRSLCGRRETAEPYQFHRATDAQVFMGSVAAGEPGAGSQGASARGTSTDRGRRGRFQGRGRAGVASLPAGRCRGGRPQAPRFPPGGRALSGCQTGWPFLDPGSGDAGWTVTGVVCPAFWRLRATPDEEDLSWANR